VRLEAGYFAFPTGRVGVILATSVVVLLGGCRALPPSMPPTPGYVSLDRRNLRHPDFSVSALGAYPLEELAGRVAVEPYVTSRLSVPIEGRGGWPGNLQLRVGPRYRAADWLALGIGGGFTLFQLDNRDEASGFGHVDLELVLGWRWYRVGLSIGLRPMIGGGGRVHGDGYPGFLSALGDLSVAIFASRASAVVIHVGGYGFSWLDEPGHWYGSAFWGIGYVYNPR